LPNNSKGKPKTIGKENGGINTLLICFKIFKGLKFAIPSRKTLSE
jgi:hypothetical protein